MFGCLLPHGWLRKGGSPWLLLPVSVSSAPLRPKADLIAALSERITQIPGANYEFSQPIQLRFNELLSGVKADVAVEVFGDNMDVLLRVAQRVAGATPKRRFGHRLLDRQPQKAIPLPSSQRFCVSPDLEYNLPMDWIFHHQHQAPPILLLHGGAGASPEAAVQQQRQEVLATIGTEVWAKLNQGLPAVVAVTLAVEKLEDCPLFNAGRGAVLQSDGLARLSASLMDGARQKFSGVMLATHILHPSRLAAYLQNREESVVGPLGAQLIARELGIPPELPLTSESIERWTKTLAEREAITDQRIGTVGAVALDLSGRLAAATSTGGGSANFPERISDSATVAGNYASGYAAISCTGKGEEIVDDGLAVRLETRVRDGESLISASRKTLEEAQGCLRRYGWIGIDHTGNRVVCCTTEAIAWWGNPNEAKASDPHQAGL